MKLLPKFGAKSKDPKPDPATTSATAPDRPATSTAAPDPTPAAGSASAAGPTREPSRATESGTADSLRASESRAAESSRPNSDPAEVPSSATSPSSSKLDLEAAATTRTGDDKSLEEINKGLAPPDPDAGPEGPTGLKGKGLVAALKRTFQQYSADNVSDWAAALTYYGILSIFPAALALVSVLGLIASDGQATVENTVKQIVPDAQIQGLIDQVLGQVKDPGTAGFAAVIGIVLAFWSASGYVAAFMRASNAVYDVPEGRPIWKTIPIRLGVTALVGLILVASAFIVIFTGGVAEAVGNAVGLGSQSVFVWGIVKWPVLIILVSLMFSILYWFSPNARTGGFRWVSPGGIFAVLLWVIASAAFAIYLGNFASYNKTYGTLGSAIAFLVWLWISNLATLLGCELDAELERGRAIAAGHPADEEPFLQLRDDRKLKKGSEKGLSTN